MEGMGLKFTPVVVGCLLGPAGMFGPMADMTLLGLIASPNSPNRGHIQLPTLWSSHYPPNPPPTHIPLHVPL